MLIRESSSSDIESIYQLWLELMEYHKSHHKIFRIGDSSKELVLSSLSKRMQQEDTKVFVGEEDGKIIGMIITMYSTGMETFLLNKKGYIAETIISESYRSKGVGSELFLAAETWLRSKGADHIELQVSFVNTKARKFWSENGFVVSTSHMIKELT
jgi:GNAT superfamily N-acetyltransferase